MTAAIMAGTTLFSGSGKAVHATATDGGEELWSADVPGKVTDLAFHGGRLYAVCVSGEIVCFK